MNINRAKYIHLIAKQDQKNGVRKIRNGSVKTPEAIKREFKSWKDSRSSFERAAFCAGATPSQLREGLKIKSLTLFNASPKVIRKTISKRAA